MFSRTVQDAFVRRLLNNWYQIMTDVISALEGCQGFLSNTVTLPPPLKPIDELNQTILLGDDQSLATINTAQFEKVTRPPKKRDKKLALIGAALLGVAMLAVIIISLKTHDAGDN